MASPEEALDNLRQFCAVLASTNEKLLGTVDALDAHSDAYGDLDHTAQDQIGGLNDDLTTDLQELRQAGDEATAEVGQLADAARVTADTQLGQEQADLDAAENEFNQRLQADGSDLDTAFSSLNDTGFDPLAGTIADAGASVNQAGTENAQAFADLGTEAADLEVRVSDAESEASQTLDDVGGSLKGDEAGALESGAAEAIDGWVTQVPGELASEGEHVSSALEGLYQDWASSLETEGDELMQAMADLGTRADADIESDATSLQQAVDLTTDTTLAQLEGDLEQTEGVMTTGLELALTAPPIVADLIIVKHVIDQIEKLLEAL